ncbi:MAG: hypothetical protein ACTSRE_08905 [Promethearchaeota archaeon]
MEDKKDHLDFGKFWDSLDDEMEMEFEDTNTSLIEKKPLLPKRPHPSRQLQPQNRSQVNSMKIERKTPLDSMVRRNQQQKNNSQKMPTYRDIRRLDAPKKRLDPIKKPVSYPTYKQQQTQQQKSYQQENHTLYPRYTPEKKPTPPSNTQQGSNYLRAQMLKELRSQQDRQPVNTTRERLQPPRVSIPPRPNPVNYSQPSAQPQAYFRQETPTSYKPPSSYQQPEPESEIIDEPELIHSLKQITDATKIDVLMKLLDGRWHTDAELIRVAKKSRDFIGAVGFVMLMCSFEDSISKSFLMKKMNPGNMTQFKIHENFIELARSAYSKYLKTEN